MKSLSGQYICGVLVSALLALTISSCGVKGKSLSREEVLMQRVRVYWELVVNRDYARSYQYEYPVFRKKTDMTRYRARRSNPLAVYRQAHVVDGVEIKENGLAEVKMLFEIALKPPGLKTPAVFKIRRPDKWVEIDGEWYHVPKETGVKH